MDFPSLFLDPTETNTQSGPVLGGQVKRRAHLVDAYLKMALFMYYQCTDHNALVDVARRNVDDGLGYFDTALRILLDDTSSNAQQVDDVEQLMIDAVLRFNLEVIRAALKRSDSQGAKMFTERMFEYRRHRSMHWQDGEPAVLEATYDAIMDYLAMILLGWALELLHNGYGVSEESAQSVFDIARRQVPRLEAAVAEWELFRDRSWPDAPIDSRLGIEHWDPRDYVRDYRSGGVVVDWGGDSWKNLGFNATLLNAESQDGFVRQGLFKAPPTRSMWDAEARKNELEALLDDKWIGVPEEQRPDRLKRATTLIKRRSREADVAYLRYVIDEPILDERREEFRKETLAGFSKRADWMKALFSLGVGSEAATQEPAPTKRGEWVPREYLLDDNNWAKGFGSHLGEKGSHHETMEILHLVETEASASCELNSLDEIQEKIGAVVAELRDAGFNPNLIMIPRAGRFSGALFGMPWFQIPEHRNFGQAGVGVWEKIQVLNCPYMNTKSIVVADTQKLLTTSVSTHPQSIEVDIEDPPDKGDAPEDLQKAKDALESLDAELPKSSSVSVLGWVTATPRLGIADSSAARSIRLNASGVGFALTKDDDLYHRAVCKKINQASAVEHVLYLGGPGAEEKRQPCPDCHPEKWDEEGRRGSSEESEGSGDSDG